MHLTKPFHSSAHGLSVGDLRQIPFVAELISTVRAGLFSDDQDDLQLALFFFESVIRVGRCAELDDGLRVELRERLLTLIESPDSNTRNAAMPLLAVIRDDLRFRPLMLKCLADPDARIRSRALTSSGLFLSREDVKYLMPFAIDDHVDEVNMGGERRYTLRDEALRQLEKIAGRSFGRSELSVVTTAGVVTWWSWDPVWDWYGRR